MHVQKQKTSKAKASGLRGQPCMPAKKYRFNPKTPMMKSGK